VLQKGQSVIINWIFQSVTKGKECVIKLDIAGCYKRDRV
jgi:hypothetical protein